MFSFFFFLKVGLFPSTLDTSGVIKDCGVSRERHSFDMNECSRRGILDRENRK